MLAALTTTSYQCALGKYHGWEQNKQMELEYFRGVCLTQCREGMWIIDLKWIVKWYKQILGNDVSKSVSSYCSACEIFHMEVRVTKVSDKRDQILTFHTVDVLGVTLWACLAPQQEGLTEQIFTFIFSHLTDTLVQLTNEEQQPSYSKSGGLLRV